MKFTNKLNLPQPIFDAVSQDSYTKGDAEMSVTGLLKPPRITALEYVYGNEIIEDASDRIFSLCGQVIHEILERAQRTGIAERRLSMEVEGWRISGGMDAYYEEGILQDYKFVTVWKFKDSQVPEEYEQQLNCYAELLRENNHYVNKLQIVGILRDWSKMEARRDPSYPQTQVVVRNVLLWSPEKAKKFIRERVILHQQARVAFIPECSKEERWARADTWAVMKVGAKRALKLYDNEPSAMLHAAENKDLCVVYRPGESIRCLNYCSVSKFCAQFQGEKMPEQDSA